MCAELGGIYFDLGDDRKALPHIEEGVAAGLSDFGSDHSALAGRHGVLARVLWICGDQARASLHALEARRLAALLPEGSSTRTRTIEMTGLLLKERR